MHPLQELLLNRKQNPLRGIPSICTAHPIVLEAVMERYLESTCPLLIEATANQVNQNGGYTGLTPVDFVEMMTEMAQRLGFPVERLILGGDHLGPLTWTSLPEEEAMAHAEVLVRAYVEAGFTKIHLDTSMCLASDDPNLPLSDLTIATRGVRLLAAAEAAFAIRKQHVKDAVAPIYVVGSEVPIPGGAQETEAMQVTSPAAYLATVNVYRQLIEAAGLQEAGSRIVAVVVQPGVEFADLSVHAYHAETASALTSALKKTPELVFEGHSTDYQTPAALKAMVEDGIAILKVGPALTFAYRESLFGLAAVEAVLQPDQPANFIEVLESVMLDQPNVWKKHYHGTEAHIALSRKYSYSDRSRYVMPDPRVEAARQRLLETTVHAPLPVLSQYLPEAYQAVMEGHCPLRPDAWAKVKVKRVVSDYLAAVGA